MAKALELFAALTAPEAPGVGDVRREPFSRVEAVSKFARDGDEKRIISDGIAMLAPRVAAQLAAIMEAHLRAALEIEAQGEDLQTVLVRSWWRSAIEDSDQDLGRAYEHVLLRGLRDTLHTWAQQSAAEAGHTIERYLGDRVSIFRRLGLHLLGSFPERYPPLLSRSLMETGNLDDIRIRHEFFLLMENGFPFLEASEQASLIHSIHLGPAQERLEELAESVAGEHHIDKAEYIENQRKLWIRDRLWMIRAHLPSQSATALQELIAQYGEPDHPTFSTWTSGVFWVQDVSPISDATLSQMPAGALVSYLAQWQPSTQRRAQPEVVSYEGLAKAMAEVVIRQPEKYQDHVVQAALLRPEYAVVLLDKFRDPGEGRAIPWELAIDLCEGLLADDDRRVSVEAVGDKDWISVRMGIVRLLEVGLGDPERPIPDSSLGRVRDLLLILIDDPDPDSVSDHPPEGWFGHNDPLTVAINRVRPAALIALIRYAGKVAMSPPIATGDGESTQRGPERMETVVRDALTRKLDRTTDPSWAVHSVFGQFLPQLHWLDKGWMESHLDDILPMAEDDLSRSFFVAAWDSFVVRNPFDTSMLELLRARYECAVDNLAHGLVTPSHLQPESGLATHLAWEYLLGSYDPRSSTGQDSLVASYFAKVSRENRGSVAWALWRISAANPDERKAHWPRIRALWEWRAQAASEAGNSTDYDDEMQSFVRLLSVVPRDMETISTMRPLLEALLPHMTRPEFPNLAWIQTEEYLSSEVDRDPLMAVEFYRLMHEQLSGPVVHYADEARTILEKAAAAKVARTEALSLMDSIARFGDHRFRDIYERYPR